MANLREGDEAAARTALAQLCQIYWQPIYAFLRRAGHPPADAEDGAQGFFAYLISHDKLLEAGPERGKLRTFLLGRLKGWLATQQRTAARLKRGGGQTALSIDAEEFEQRLPAELVDAHTPDVAFDRAWLVTVLGRALEGLRAECEAEGKGAQFAALQPMLTEGAEENYATVAARIGTSEGAARVAVHRLRARYRERLLREVADTVDGPQELGGELAELFAAAR